MGSTFVIAEAGVNHNGSFETAKRLVDAAHAAGADAIKFQTFKAENVVSRSAPRAEYQAANTGDTGSQLSMLKKLELSFDEFRQLFAYCKEKKISFMSTAFDFESIDLLEDMGVGIHKIPSGEITNYPYLKKLASLKRPVLLSTGMASIGEVESALEVLVRNGCPRDTITVLHANTEYPTPYEDVNLRAMDTLRQAFGVSVGYSDHTRGIEIPVAAVALGASVIEKHFTLDRRMEGPDHKASLEPGELSQMITSIRNIEAAMGDGIKRPSQSEAKNIAIARRSIVAARPIAKGERLSDANLTAKRPANGISPMRWDEVVGQVASKDYDMDEPI